MDGLMKHRRCVFSFTFAGWSNTSYAIANIHREANAACFLHLLLEKMQKAILLLGVGFSLSLLFLLVVNVINIKLS